MDMDEIVLDVNDKHMTAWVEACHRDSIPNTPLNPYLDKVMRNCYYRPQTKFAKVMFLHVSVCPRGGWGWYPSMPCSRGWYPRMPCSRGASKPTPRGKLRGLARGVSRPTSGEGLQAHTQGVYPSMH